MSKRKRNTFDNEQPVRKKIHLSVDISNKSINSLNNEDNDVGLPDVLDLSGINKDEIESTIYEAIQRNNISNAKAKYLIRKMLKHPHVVEWFRDLFSSDKPQFNLLYEPRITRSAKRKVGENEDSTISGIDANLIGRLILSAPTINSYEFDNDDNNDIDYLPDSENSVDSDLSSLTSDIGNKNHREITLSPYRTRSKATINDLQVDFLDDSLFEFEDIFNKNDPINPALSIEDINSLMEVDIDDQQYAEFKKSLITDDFKNDETEDDPEFDVLAQIDDLDEDIFDDIRDDRSVKIPRSELWALLKDNNLVKGNGSSSTNKKTITMLCEDDEISYNEPCSNIKEMLVEMIFTDEQRERLSRQIIMFYQQLATVYVMIYDQHHLKQIIDTQLSFFFRMTSNISENLLPSVFNPPNRCVVEKILFNYKGISYIPTSRFTNSTLFRKIDFPKCIMATLLCSSAFPYVQLLPSSFKLHNHIPLDFFRQIPFLPSEDKLLTMGIIQFSHQCHKMLKLIKKYLFPIRSTDQLRNRKTNIIRRQKDLNHRESELFAELFQYSGYLNVNKKNMIRVHSDLSKLPVHFTPIWQRKDDWKSLPDVYKSFLTKTVPNIMYNFHLCTKDEWSRSNRIANNKKTYPTKEFQFCNWSSLPWELEKVDFVRNENKQNYVKTVLRKIVNKKSFPQYEIPKNSQLREFLKKWNNNCDKNNFTQTKKAKISNNRNLIFLKKSVKRAKRFCQKFILKKEQEKLQTEKRYAHYFRNDEMANLFPNTVFRLRLEELLAAKDIKNPRLQRFQVTQFFLEPVINNFQNKCRDKKMNIVDFTSASYVNNDEDDLIFCRNLLNDLRNSLNADAYERCLDKIIEFQLTENFDDSVLELMKFLMNIVKQESDNVDIYEDFLCLLNFQQAVKLGCEIDWWTVRNINQLYSMIKFVNLSHKRRFWVRLSSLLNKSGEGIDNMNKVIQYLHSSVKNNGYAQMLIAQLLNCWKVPFPNFPQTFSNCDALSSNPNFLEFSKHSDRDMWDYYTDLAEQPKNSCSCSCHEHNNVTVNTIRHCTRCNLKTFNGSIFIDESKIHKRYVTIDFKQAPTARRDHFFDDIVKTSNQKTDPTMSMSVLEFLKTKTTQNKQIHNRCISIRETNPKIIENSRENEQDPQWTVLPNVNTLQYMQVLEDGEAAMDTEVFRQIKGQQQSTSSNESHLNLQIPTFEGTVKFESNNSFQNWTDDDNLLLLKLCQKHGPTASTFLYLQGAHFTDRSLEQIEEQFNHLFLQVLDYQNQS